MTNLQRSIDAAIAISDLLDSYELAQSSEKIRAEIIDEIGQHSRLMLAELEEMKDNLGTAYGVLAKAIQLPMCENCMGEM